MWMRVLCVMVALALPGCGLTQVQKDTIGEFGRSSASFSETVGAELADARRAVMEANTSVLILTPQRIKDRERLDGALTPDRVGARVRAAETLRTYAELLVALVEETGQADLANASAKFTDSIRGLDPESRRLNEEQLTAVGELVQDIGGLVVDYKKRKALEKIVPQADAQVQRIAGLFAAEFGQDGPLTTYVNGMGALAVSAADSVLDQPNASLQDRIPAVEANRRGVELRRTTETVYLEIARAAAQLKAGHADLVQAVQGRTVTRADLTALTKTVKTLVSHAKTVLIK